MTIAMICDYIGITAFNITALTGLDRLDGLDGLDRLDNAVRFPVGRLRESIILEHIKSLNQ